MENSHVLFDTAVHRFTLEGRLGSLRVDPAFFNEQFRNERLFREMEVAYRSRYGHCVLISSVEHKRSFLAHLVRLAAKMFGTGEGDDLRHQIHSRLFPARRQPPTQAAAAKHRSQLEKHVADVLKRHADRKWLLQQAEDRLRAPIPFRGAVATRIPKAGQPYDCDGGCSVEELLGLQAEAALEELENFSNEMVDGEGKGEETTEKGEENESEDEEEEEEDAGDYLNSMFALRFVTVTEEGIQSLRAIPGKINQAILVSDVHDILPSPFDVEGGWRDGKGDGDDDRRGQWMRKDTVLRHLRSLAQDPDSRTRFMLLSPVVPVAGSGHTAPRYVWEPFEALGRVHGQMQEKMQPIRSLLKVDGPTRNLPKTEGQATEGNAARVPYTSLKINGIEVRDALSARRCLEDGARLRRTIDHSLGSYSKNPVALREADSIYYRIEGALSALNCSNGKIREVTLVPLSTSLVENENTLIVFNSELSTAFASNRDVLSGFIKCQREAVSTVISLDRVVWIDSQMPQKVASMRLATAHSAGHRHGGVILFMDAALLHPRSRFPLHEIDLAWVHHLQLASPPRSLHDYIQMLRRFPSLRSPPVCHVGTIDENTLFLTRQRLLNENRTQGEPRPAPAATSVEEVKTEEEGQEQQVEAERGQQQQASPVEVDNFLQELLVTSSNLARYSVFRDTIPDAKASGLFNDEPPPGTTIDTVYLARVLYEAYVVKSFTRSLVPVVGNGKGYSR